MESKNVCCVVLNALQLVSDTLQSGSCIDEATVTAAFSHIFFGHPALAEVCSRLHCAKVKKVGSGLSMSHLVHAVVSRATSH